MKKSLLKNYAKLIVQVGANIQKGQDVVITFDPEITYFANMVAEECLKAKCGQIRMNYMNDELTKLMFKHKSVKELSKINDWQIAQMEYETKTLPTTIYLESQDPDGLKDVNHKKMAEVRQNKYLITKKYIDARQDKYQWVIAGVPGEKWAKKVFPNLRKSQAIEKLWEEILKASHAYNDDPFTSWQKHEEELKDKMNKLNSLHLDHLHYKASNGTDFTVWLSDDIIWMAGGEKCQTNNVQYSPNIPTEECFTTPIKGRAEGIVYATKPLSYNSTIIEDFSVRFENGKVVEVKVKKNQDVLEQMVKMDENACYLGEVALVPYESPINLSNILFFNTLYDENACCHLALGNGFGSLVKGYENMTLEQIKEKGVNSSMIHVDFMIGCRDLNITGYTKDGQEIKIFENGTWAI